MKKIALTVLLLTCTFGLIADDSDGQLESPVPEPASMLIMGAGLAGVAFLGWKRNKKK